MLRLRSIASLAIPFTLLAAPAANFTIDALQTSLRALRTADRAGDAGQSGETYQVRSGQIVDGGTVAGVLP